MLCSACDCLPHSRHNPVSSSDLELALKVVDHKLSMTTGTEILEMTISERKVDLIKASDIGIIYTLQTAIGDDLLFRGLLSLICRIFWQNTCSRNLATFPCHAI